MGRWSFDLSNRRICRISAESAIEIPEARQIHQLSAAVVTSASKSKGEWHFVGWDGEDRPTSSDTVAGLARSAHRAFVIYRESGLWPRQIRYRSVEAAEYILTGPAIDFADYGDRRAQDQLQYVVLDADGERRDVALGELAVLEAIVSAREPWQTVENGSSTDIARSAVSLYTLFVANPSGPPGHGLALLFRPTLPGAGNEAAFRAFVRQSLGRLLVLDETQPAADRKGFVEAAAVHAGLSPQNGASAVLVRLREIGFIDFDDTWLRGWQQRAGGVRAGLFRVLRAVGAVDVSDNALREMAHPRPDYDLDRLATNKLVDLAESMYWAAHSAFKGDGSRDD